MFRKVEVGYLKFWAVQGLAFSIKPFKNGTMFSDEINFTTAIDGKMADQYSTFAPYCNVREMDRPHKVSGNIYVSKPLVGSLAEYLSCETE